MTADSDWGGLRARLVQLQEAGAAEIGAYPAPIPACDAQYNHLRARRAKPAHVVALGGSTVRSVSLVFQLGRPMRRSSCALRSSTMRL